MSQGSWWFTGISIFLVIGLAALVISLIIRTYSKHAATGREDLKGRVALVRTALNPEGVVAVEGELWNAISKSGQVEAGQEVIVLEVKGLILVVENKTKE